MQTGSHLPYAVIVIHVKLFADDKRQQIVYSTVVCIRGTNESNPERRSIRSVWRGSRWPRVLRQFHQTINTFARPKMSPYIIGNVRLQNAAAGVNLLKIRRRIRHFVS